VTGVTRGPGTRTERCSRVQVIDSQMFKLEPNRFGARVSAKLGGYFRMDTEEIEPAEEPWPQQLLESPWLLAGAALLFFTLSYVVWGLIDILSLASG
jgi:hypothetical protein